MISIIPFILIHTLFYVGYSDDLPLTTTLPQSPTLFLPPFHIYHQISKPYSSYEPLEESKRRSPPPRRRSPPPPPRRRSPPPPPPRIRSPPPPPPRIRSPPPPPPRIRSPPPPPPSPPPPPPSPPPPPPPSPSPPPPPPSPPPPPPPLSFDHFVLSQTWPPTYCKIKNNKCVSPEPLKFVIHGLWPSKKDTLIQDCDEKIIDVNDLEPLMEELNEDWPALFENDNQTEANIQLWVDQWNGHGTCSVELFEFVPYFEETLNVYHRNSIKDILIENDINPGGTFPKEIILNAIHTHISFMPQLRCKRINDTDYLFEIRLCLTASVELEYKDCDTPYSGCHNEDVYF
ncbi:unnamed protein product [Lathyrus oleraceus]